MSREGLSETQNQLLATYCGTNIETICRELTAVDDPDVDPDFRPQALNGLPWWTMKIPKALKYRPLFEKAWDEGHDAGWEERHEDALINWVPSGPHESDAHNPYKETK